MALAAAVMAAAVLSLSSASAVRAVTLHQAVSLRSPYIAFYAGHLVLDAQNGATLDDGVYHIKAQRIILDLRSHRYVAIGDVTVCSPNCTRAVAFGDDLDIGRGVVMAVDPSPDRTELCNGHICLASDPQKADPPGDPPDEPLALPDTQGEAPFAISTGAVSHVGADVRLQDARVVTPGAHQFFLPSYVYLYSADPGYTLSNLPGGSEDIPIYVGSTRNSIQGLHFMYNQTTKFGVGVDEHIVNGQRSYMLLSEAPLVGPNKVANFTWFHQINAHTTQTLTSSEIQNAGWLNTYDVRDSVHRSFFELTGNQLHQIYAGTLGWQGFDQQVAPRGVGSLFYYHLRSEYGATHNPFLTPFFPLPSNAIMPHDIYHGTLEGYVATRPLAIGSDDTLTFSFDDRQTRDTLPHTQTLQLYSANLSHRWNRHLTTGFSDGIEPIHDFYPTVNAGTDTRLNTQTISAFYSNGNAFGLSVYATHNFAFSDNLTTFTVQPWFLTADVRFRLGRALALDVSRSYNFNYQGRTWGGFGFQLLP
jgi:hypothetical protein